MINVVIADSVLSVLLDAVVSFFDELEACACCCCDVDGAGSSDITILSICLRICFLGIRLLTSVSESLSESASISMISEISVISSSSERRLWIIAIKNETKINKMFYSVSTQFLYKKLILIKNCLLVSTYRRRFSCCWFANEFPNNEYLMWNMWIFYFLEREFYNYW